MIAYYRYIPEIYLVVIAPHIGRPKIASPAIDGIRREVSIQLSDKKNVENVCYIGAAGRVGWCARCRSGALRRRHPHGGAAMRRDGRRRDERSGRHPTNVDVRN
jgi:hypothetical protein